MHGVRPGQGFCSSYRLPKTGKRYPNRLIFRPIERCRIQRSEEITYGLRALAQLHTDAAEIHIDVWRNRGTVQRKQIPRFCSLRISQVSLENSKPAVGLEIVWLEFDRPSHTLDRLQVITGPNECAAEIDLFLSENLHTTYLCTTLAILTLGVLWGL